MTKSFITFSDYLEGYQAKGIIDHRLRVVSGPNGETDFYIHAENSDSETGDFTVINGATCIQIEEGYSAGSRPPENRTEEE